MLVRARMKFEVSRVCIKIMNALDTDASRHASRSVQAARDVGGRSRAQHGHVWRLRAGCASHICMVSILRLCTSDGDCGLVAHHYTSEHVKVAVNHAAALLQITMGSTNVRVGSTIFGARNYDK